MYITFFPEKLGPRDGSGGSCHGPGLAGRRRTSTSETATSGSLGGPGHVDILSVLPPIPPIEESTEHNSMSQSGLANPLADGGRFSYSVIQCPRAARRTPRFDASMAAASQPLPTTPPRMPTVPLSAPPVRQSNRTRTLSARGRAMAEEGSVEEMSSRFRKTFASGSVLKRPASSLRHQIRPRIGAQRKSTNPLSNVSDCHLSPSGLEYSLGSERCP